MFRDLLLTLTLNLVPGPAVFDVFLKQLSNSLTKLSLLGQEMVDCHHAGCLELGYTPLINWLVVNDRLAPAEKYANYRSQKYTCRAATSVDGLTNIRVTGYRDISVDDFEEEFMS